MTATQKKRTYTQDNVIEYFEHLANKKMKGAQFNWRSKEQAFYVADAYMKNNDIEDDPIMYAMDNGVMLKSAASPSDRPTKAILSEPMVGSKPVVESEPVAIKPDLKSVPIKPKKPHKMNKVFEKFMNINPATIQRKRQDGDDYFIILERGVIRNPDCIKIFSVKGVAVVYYYLWANLVRPGKFSDRYNLVENYYEKGLLAYSTSIRKIAKECSLSPRYTMDIINLLKHIGIIRVDKAPAEERGNKEPQNIYILGTTKTVKSATAKDKPKGEHSQFVNN